jgi:hypothetical protein
LATIWPLALALFAFAPPASAQRLPLDEAGWTILRPSDDTRILYVSSSEGNDANARPCLPRDREIGPDPFLPAGKVRPFKTVEKAIAAAREGAPDWVLLKRGDHWLERLQTKSGRSASAPFLVAAYGPGTERPQLRNGPKAALVLNGKGFHDVAIVGIEFYAHTRDPDSSAFQGPELANSGVALADGRIGERLLLEDCAFRFNSLTLQAQGQATLRALVLRRCLFLDAYASGTHCQGVLAANAQFLMEENVFDHNGWNENPKLAKAGATIYNHNAYFSKCGNSVFRGNTVLRSSSIGTKWRCDSAGGMANVVIDNNLYVEGELGISIGGNTNEPFRFRNSFVANNVFSDIGKARPTNRNLSWALETFDWDQGTIANNLFIHQTETSLISTYAINLGRSQRDVAVRDNIAYGLTSKGPLVIFDGGAQQTKVLVANNWFETPSDSNPLLRALEPLEGYSFQKNAYKRSNGGAAFFQVSKRNLSPNEWTQLAREPLAAKPTNFPDPKRTLEAYQHSLKLDPAFSTFLKQVRLQSKTHWRPELTAFAVNDYLRAGFNLNKAEPPPDSITTQDPSNQNPEFEAAAAPKSANHKSDASSQNKGSLRSTRRPSNSGKGANNKP